MDFLSMILIAISVCIDNFALSMAFNLQAGPKKKQTIGKILIIFPFVQMGLALIGWFAGTGLSQFIDNFDHWIVFGLLAYIGIKLIVESIKEMQDNDEKCACNECRDNNTSDEGNNDGTQRESPSRKCNDEIGEKKKAKMSLTVIALLGVALATSTDSLAVGLTYALLDVNILHAILLIGAVTALLSILGFGLGEKLGEKFETRVELIAGIVLFLVGLKIVIEHLVA